MPSSRSPTAKTSPRAQLQECSTSRYPPAIFLLACKISDRSQGKAKQKAWQKEVDAGTKAPDAQKKYVTLVNKLKTTYGYDPNKSPEAVGS